MVATLESSVIRIYSNNGQVVGAGFLVSPKRILTCAHVVAEALGLAIETAKRPDAEIQLDFPMVAAKQFFKAKVVFWRPVNPDEFAEDIAGLELESSPPKAAQPARLVTANGLWGDPFKVLGFPASQPEGAWAHGELRAQQGKGWVQLEGVKVTGYRLEHGFSGAPIWDEMLQGVAGMAVAAEFNRPDAKAAFMIPTKVLCEAWEELGEQVMPQQPIVNPQPTSHKVFIAYCRKEPDFSLANQFYKAIKEAGHEAFMAKRSIRLGEKWFWRIRTELAQCDYFLLLLSEESAKSANVKKELEWVHQLHQERDEHNPNPTILTIRVKFPSKRDSLLDNFELRTFLNQFHYLQWRNDDDTPRIQKEILTLLNHQGELPTETNPVEETVNLLSSTRRNRRATTNKPVIRWKIIGFIGMIICIGIIGRAGWQFLPMITTIKATPPKIIETPDELSSELFSQGERTFFPIDENFYKNSGIEAFRNKKFAEAKRNFEKARKLKANDPESLIYYNNAKAWEKSNPLTLAVVVPVGTKGKIAETILRGVAHAQDDFNSNGGLANRLLNIVIADDNDDSKQAQKVAQELIENPKFSNVIGVIGHITSRASEAALPKYEKARLAMISPTSTSTSLSGEVFFRTVPSDKINAEKLATYAIKHNIRRTVVFYKEDAYGESLKTEFTTLFKEKGGEILRTVELKPDLDVPAEVSRSISLDKADAAIFFTNTELTDVVVEIAQEAQKTVPNRQKRLKLLGGDGLYQKTTLDKGGANIEGLILAVPWFAKEQNGNPKEFAKKAQEKWGTMQINWRTASSYDTTQAFIKAISMSDKPNRETVLKNLKSVNLSPDKTSGDALNFSESERKQEPVLVQVVRGSRCKEVGEFCFELVK